MDRDQRRRDVRDRGRRHDLGGAQPRRRRLQLAGPAPGDRPVRPQARDGGRRARQPLPAEPLRRLPLARRRPQLGGRQRGPVVGVRVRHGHPPARRRDGLGDPAEPPRGGPRRARRRARRLADAATAATAGSARRTACPRRTPTSASCARRCRSTAATPPASTSGRAPASSTARPTRARPGARIADNLPPIWGVQAIEVD